MRKLSESKNNKELFAYCNKCIEFFIDDLQNYGSILCPNGCGSAIERGLILFNGAICRIVNGKAMPIVKQE